MQGKYPRIVFMGTPELAVHILDAILREKYEVAAVVTAPDRPAGRGRKLKPSPVKQFAAANKLNILQPENLKSPAFIDTLQHLKPDLQVVVAFRMLPEAVWSIPPLGTFNLHASLLPDYRGAAPINHVIINGEKETGVTTFLIDRQIDTGNILLRKSIPINDYETAGTLHDKVIDAGAPLVIKTIEGLVSNSIRPVHQDEFIANQQLLRKAPKIYRDDCEIDWHKPARQIVNLIHGLSPYPGAFCHIKENRDDLMQVKIFEARPVIEKHRLAPGTVVTDHKMRLWFATKDGFVEVLRLQLPGKKQMSTEELLRGYRFTHFKSFDDPRQ